MSGLGRFSLFLRLAFSPRRFDTTSPTPQALPGLEIVGILWKKHFWSQSPSRVLQQRQGHQGVRVLSAERGEGTGRTQWEVG